MAGSALSGFVGGMQQGYTFVADARDKQAAEDRLVKADARRDMDAEFQDETRGRQRKVWTKEDENLAIDDEIRRGQDARRAEKDRVWAESQQSKLTTLPPAGLPAIGTAPPTAPAMSAAPVSELPPKWAPEPAPAMSAAPVSRAPTLTQPQPAGIPAAAPQAPQMGLSAPVDANTATKPPAANQARPRSLESFYNDQLELLQSKVQRGTADLKSFDDAKRLVENHKTEGIDKAIKLWHRGLGKEGVEAMNAMGTQDGVELVSMKPGVEIIDGVKIPTMIVTTRSPDGKLGTVNTAQVMATTRRIEDVITSGQKAADQAETHTNNQATRENARYNSETQRLNVNNNAAEARARIAIAKAGEARTIAAAALEAKVPKAVQMAYAPILKEMDVIAAAIVKAQAEGAFNVDSPSAKSLTERQALLSIKANKLLAPYLSDTGASAGKDVLGFNARTPEAPAKAPPATTAKVVPNPVAPSTRLAPPPAGLPITRPGSADANGKAVDVRNDTVLASLRKSLSALDANDPKNVAAMMAIGNARNQRIDQLRQDHGTTTNLITE